MKKLLALFSTMLLALSLVGCSESDIKSYGNKVDREEFCDQLIKKVSEYDEKNYTVDVKMHLYSLDERKHDDGKFIKKTDMLETYKIEYDYNLNIINRVYKKVGYTSRNDEKDEINLERNETCQKIEDKYYEFNNKDMTVKESNNSIMYLYVYSLVGVSAIVDNCYGDTYIDGNVFTVERKEAEKSHGYRYITQFVFNENEVLVTDNSNSYSNGGAIESTLEKTNEYVYNFIDFTLESKKLEDYQLV